MELEYDINLLVVDVPFTFTWKNERLNKYKKSYAKGILRFLVMIHTFWPWARMDLCTSSYSNMYLTMTTTEICVVYTYSVLLTCQTGRYGIAFKAYWTLQPKLLYIQYRNSHRLQWIWIYIVCCIQTCLSYINNLILFAKMSE